MASIANILPTSGRSRIRRRRINGLWGASAGVSAIEFAMVAGILSVLLLGIVDFGRGFWEQMQVGEAARAGAAYAANEGFAGYNSTNIQSAATGATSLSGVQATPSSPFCGCPSVSSGITTSTCGAACASGGTAGHYVTVTAQASFATLFTWPGLARSITLNSSATVRIH